MEDIGYGISGSVPLRLADPVPLRQEDPRSLVLADYSPLRAFRAVADTALEGSASALSNAFRNQVDSNG
jgi:hypothetical protein